MPGQQESFTYSRDFHPLFGGKIVLPALVNLKDGLFPFWFLQTYLDHLLNDLNLEKSLEETVLEPLLLVP